MIPSPMSANTMIALGLTVGHSSSGPPVKYTLDGVGIGVATGGCSGATVVCGCGSDGIGAEVALAMGSGCGVAMSSIS